MEKKMSPGKNKHPDDSEKFKKKSVKKSEPDEKENVKEAQDPLPENDSPKDGEPEGTDLMQTLKAEIEELKSSRLRQMAEFDNFKKRVSKEKAEVYGYAAACVIETLLPALDNLERALGAASEESELKKGLEMVLAQINDIFGKLGVTEIDCKDQIFDPELHNAAARKEDENYGDNTICEVLQKGYKYNDKVIRHAMVIVANP
ncbi:MAG: nucleotide exchange factor GrpE [Oscillospiraceae bacterium]|nr:nucleotide exchange factor GrpE [Oscillospiraceae bacterium]